MGKLKIKKSDVWIDMTPMSDVMVLLLTFFMLTSTFVKNEPVKVNQPSSVSEIKVPEKDVLNILVDKQGKVFMGMDNQNDLLALIQGMNETGNLGLNALEMKKFQTDPLWGIRLSSLKGYLDLPQEKMTEVITGNEAGVPLDSINGGKSEFQLWVTEALKVNDDIKIAIKADATTPYQRIKKVMSELQDMNQNRYYLITSLKTGEDK
ncbi:biopolymer transporter ExbD [Prevotella sp. A2931]|uniref:Biopolymer transporter ExbD n=1 Tax=Prevotella illustrans TaxID=2800387 RepID=A0ABS3M5D6_9BACT|nr:MULTISPECIES: biopolymer transporter ExbD [Prevotella]MBO1363388.1 biopolymer transporter ExbD [Prevotella illustrans]PTL26128.1 biopolymer transporter ExbD [Prevotella sp. oral taxon 820]